MLIAKITGKNINYDMTKDVISIGRNSASGNVDIDMGNSTTFVSRRHIELHYSHSILKLRCLGKNGIFVNDSFKAHSSKPCIMYDLPYKCVLRFPSTNVKLNVTLAVEPKVESILPSNAMNSDFQSEREDQSFIHPSPKKKAMMSLTTAYDHSTFQDASALLSLKGHNQPFRPVSHDDDDSHYMTSKSIIPDENQTRIEIKEHLLKSDSMDSSSHIDSSSDQQQSFSNDYSYDDDMSIDRGSELTKPPYSYAQLIVQAIMSTGSQQMTLSGIYAYISQNYPYYKLKDKGWQNSIRHNLSLNRYFVKVARSQEEPGKGSFWRVDPHYKKPLIQQAFRRRRHRRLQMSSPGVSFSEHALLSNGKLFIPRGSTQFIKINKNLLGASLQSNQSLNSSLVSSAAGGYATIPGGRQEILLSSSLNASFNPDSNDIACSTSHSRSSSPRDPSSPPPVLEPNNFQVRLMGNNTSLSDHFDDTVPRKSSVDLLHQSMHSLQDSRQPGKSVLLPLESTELHASHGHNGLISLGGKLYTAVNMANPGIPAAPTAANVSLNKLPLYITADGAKYLVLPHNSPAETNVDTSRGASSFVKSNSSNFLSSSANNKMSSQSAHMSTTSSEEQPLPSSSTAQRMLISLPNQSLSSYSGVNNPHSIIKKSAQAIPNQASGPITITLKRSASPNHNSKLESQSSSIVNDCSDVSTNKIICQQALSSTQPNSSLGQSLITDSQILANSS